MLLCRAPVHLMNRRLGRLDHHLIDTDMRWSAQRCQQRHCAAFKSPERSVARLARLFRLQEVVSSNLTAPTIFAFVDVMGKVHL